MTVEELRRCSTCGDLKPLATWPRDRSKASGLKSRCHDCHLAARRRYRASPGGRAALAAYNASEAGQAAIQRAQAKASWKHGTAGDRTARKRVWKRKHPERVAAHKAVREAVRAGKLTAVVLLTCCCGAWADHYHHASYARADRLKVEAICEPCHLEIHADEPPEALGR